MAERKSNREPTKSIHIKVPSSLFTEVKLLLLNPLSGRVRHGEMSKLATSLLGTWVEKQRKEYTSDNVYKLTPSGDIIKKEIKDG